VKLVKSLPPDRSFEQIKNHYLVEKSIAKRLKESSREERKLIYATMYEELFSKVPDHPRLTRRESTQLTEISNKDKFSIVSRFLDQSIVFLEFAPGDCRFVIEVAKQVKYAYGVDISDQSNHTDTVPENFELIIYDGYNLDEIESNSIDVVFSDQLIEHLHPDDTKLHFELVHRILKAGGKYVFRTPHSLRGPFDVSKYFSDEPECFHLKEWTYSEINRVLKDLEYTTFFTYRRSKGKFVRYPYLYFAICERFLGLMPKRHIRTAAKRLIPTLCGAAIK
jgi:SAM-dependent methyltransferase